MPELEPSGYIDGETGELVRLEDNPSPAPVNLFGAPNPVAVVEQAKKVADALTEIVRERQLYKTISGKQHVLVEGWTLLGSMMGVFPVVVWTRKLENGWEARVEARTRDGSVVGAAEAECLRDEKEWGPNPTRGKPKDDYALRSMAQTRATSKALRGPLGFIVHLAGFQATPEAEIPDTPEEELRSEDQNAKLWATIGELGSLKAPVPDPVHTWEDYARDYMQKATGKKSTKQLTKREMGGLIDHLEAFTVPFG